MAIDPLETHAPKLESGSLNHVDFGIPKVSWAIRKSVSMLPAPKRRLLLVATIFQVSLGLLDLIGIALIGLVAAVAVSGIGSAGLPAPVENLLAFFGLENLTVSQLTVYLAFAAVTVLVIKSTLSAFMTRKIMRFLANRQAALSVNLARDFLRQPLTIVQRWTTSEAIYALGSGASAATVALLGSAIIIAAEAFLFAIIGISLFLYDPLVTIASGVFFAGIALFLHKVLGAVSARNAETIKTTSIDTMNAVSEALSTYREASVLNRRELYVSRYSNVVENYARASANNAFVLEIPKYVLEVSLYIGVALLGAVQFVTKDWSAAASTVALFLAAGSRVIPSMLRLQGAGITIRNSSVMAQPTYFMFDQLTSLQSDPATNLDHADSGDRMSAQKVHDNIAAGYPDFSGEVRVSHVSMTFEDSDTPVLSDISLVVPAGKSLALAGSTGAGKSTLADIILGVLSPDSGEVLLGGVSSRSAILRWSGAIAYVPQSVALVAGSVKQNVALGLPNELIDEDLVWEALKRAHLADFLTSERDGLSTYVGERGFKLSGGQRQRLGIARALYTRPKLLVLDEATSALDAETELAIIATLAELEGEVTTITVAHRLVTVRNADQLVYLEAGRIRAAGTFAQVREISPDFDHQALLQGL